MKQAVIFDFNGTLFFDTCFHKEAWSKIYCELRGEAVAEAELQSFFGDTNDASIQRMAPGLTEEERQRWSAYKETIYRDICKNNPDKVKLTAGAEALFLRLKERQIPYTLATASIKDNVDFYFQTFHLEQWFEFEKCVYDDGSYKNKGEMQVEAARKLGTTLPECIVIEDSANGIHYAVENNAGEVIGIGSNSIHQKLIHEGAAHCICNFTEFNLEWLKD